MRHCPRVAIVAACLVGTSPLSFAQRGDHSLAADVERSRARIHDPSAILKLNDVYRCFSTGRGVQTLWSEDLVNWHTGPPVFDVPPDWVEQTVPDHNGDFWAPEVIHWRGRYLLYYSVSVFGKRTSAIGLASASTLDPNSADYGWTDDGIVVQSDESVDYTAIDPAVIATPSCDLWLAFGSYWTGIKLIQLDPATGLRQHPSSPMYRLAKKNEIEAPWLCYHDGYYYLFVNWGVCCRGVRSTYNIRVGRSPIITGPYLDREGVDLANGGGTLVLDSVDEAVGPGHGSIFEQGGDQWFCYHYYNSRYGGRPQMGVNRMRWTADGWPRVETEMAFSGMIVRTGM